MCSFEISELSHPGTVGEKQNVLSLISVSAYVVCVGWPRQIALPSCSCLASFRLIHNCNLGPGLLLNLLIGFLRKYEEDVRVREQQRDQYRREQRRRGRRIRFTFPRELQSLPPVSEWVQEEVQRQQQEGIAVDAMVVDTSRGPLLIAAAYKSMYAFGNHFRVLSSERPRKTCDSGVAATFTQLCRNSSRDGNPLSAEVEYVGHIEEILELNYRRHCLVVLVCDFVKAIYRGENATIRKDKWGFTLANYARRYGRVTRDSFAFPRHCEQVFYSNARDCPGWRVVLRKEVRGKRILPSTINEEGRLFGMGRDEDYEGLRPDRAVGEHALAPAETGVDVVLEQALPPMNGRRGGRGTRANNRGAARGRRGRGGGRQGRDEHRESQHEANSNTEGEEQEIIHGQSGDQLRRRRPVGIERDGIRNVRQRSVSEEEALSTDGSTSHEEYDQLETTDSDSISSVSERSYDEHVRGLLRFHSHNQNVCFSVYMFHFFFISGFACTKSFPIVNVAV